MTLTETIAALEVRVAEAKEWCGRQVAWETAYRLTREAKERAEKAEADNARLRALVKAAEWPNVGDGNHVCQHCDAGFYETAKERPPHKASCPAFTPDGVVR